MLYQRVSVISLAPWGPCISPRGRCCKPWNHVVTAPTPRALGLKSWNLNGAWVKKLWSFVANSTCPFSICIRIVPSPLGCFLKWGQDHWLSVSNFRMTNHCDIDVQDAWSSMMICMFGGYHCCVVFFGNGNSCHWIHWTCKVRKMAGGMSTV